MFQPLPTSPITSWATLLLTFHSSFLRLQSHLYPHHIWLLQWILIPYCPHFPFPTYTSSHKMWLHLPSIHCCSSLQGYIYKMPNHMGPCGHTGLETHLGQTWSPQGYFLFSVLCYFLIFVNFSSSVYYFSIGLVQSSVFSPLYSHSALLLKHLIHVYGFHSAPPHQMTPQAPQLNWVQTEYTLPIPTSCQDPFHIIQGNHPPLSFHLPKLETWESF